MEEKDINPDKLSSLSFIDLYSIFWTNRKKIIYTCLVAGIIAVVFAFFVIKPIFLSEATVKASTDNTGLGALLGGGIPDIGELEELTGGGSVTKELALYENILTSRRSVEAAIIRFKLNDEWEYKYMQDAIKNFREEVLTITKDRISGLITIGVFDENPDRAKEMVDFLIFQLTKIYTELTVQNAKNNRQFIESRYEIVKEDLKKAEDSLKVFQTLYGISPDLTVQAAVKAEIEIESQIASEEVKLDILRKILTSDQAEIQAQEEKILALRKQLTEIQTSSSNENSLSLKGKPDVVMNFLRLKRDVEIQNKILSFILPLYEQAKIEENKEIPPVVVLDPSFIPEKKAKPKRLQIVFIVIVIAFIFSYLWFFVKDRYNALKLHMRN